MPARNMLSPTEYPQFCCQPATAVHMLTTETAVYIAYERQRDFLSAPKAFVVLEFDISALITVNASYLTDKQWQELEEQPYGVYAYKAGAHEGFIFYGEEQVIDVQASALESLSEQYHCLTATDAILKVITPDEPERPPSEAPATPVHDTTDTHEATNSDHNMSCEPTEVTEV